MRNCSKTLALVRFDPNVAAANCGPSGDPAMISVSAIRPAVARGGGIGLCLGKTGFC